MIDRSEGRPAKKSTYDVVRSEPALKPSPPGMAARPIPNVRTVAVIAVHGIGQQLQFQTLENVAEGLRSAAQRSGHEPPQPVARAVGIGKDGLQRLELDLDDGTHVDVYEAYWAPLTEGRVGLGDVLAFLFSAGLDGLWHAVRGGVFKRFIAHKLVDFPVPVRTPIYLLTALFVTCSLVMLTVAAVGLPIARALIPNSDTWVPNALFVDVTSVLNAFSVAVLVFALAMGISYGVWQWTIGRTSAWTTNRPTRTPRHALVVGWATVAVFVVLIAVTIIGGAAVLLSIALHIKSASAEITLFSGSVRNLLYERFSRVMLWVLAGAGVVGLAFVAYSIVQVFRQRQMNENKDRHPALTILIVGAFALVAVAVVGSIGAFVSVIRAAPEGRALALVLRHGAAWPVAIGASLFARSILIRYVGDVAAYIQPQHLDRFNDLREKIKQCAFNTAEAVYRSTPRYDEVIFVGHSLGSVIAYDTLNRLLREESCGDIPDVERRTGLLLTFGSPLDKTAFLFSVQGRGSEGREALAASVQPLIAFPERRPTWINIFSPWDIISGSLEFYDASPRGSSRVDNRGDPEARVWLSAHNQYWDGRLLFDTLLTHLTTHVTV